MPVRDGNWPIKSHCWKSSLGGQSCYSDGDWCFPVYKSTGHSAENFIGLLLKPGAPIPEQSDHATIRQRQAQEMRIILTLRREAAPRAHARLLGYDPMLLGSTIIHEAVHVSSFIGCSTVRSTGHGDCGWPETATGNPNPCISNVQLGEHSCGCVKM